MKQKSIQLFLLLILIKTAPLYSIPPDCEVLKYISRREVRNTELIQIDTIVYQINNRNGERYSEMSIPYSKIEKVSRIDGWIIDASGRKVRTLKSSDIEDQSQVNESTMYNDCFEKNFQLKHNTYPYKIYYTYKTISNQFIAIANWTAILDFKIPTRDAKLYLTIPKDYRVQKYIRNANLVRADSTHKNVNSYIYSSSYDKIIINQQFGEPYRNILPRIVIVPTKFIYGVNGSTESWIDYGNWFLDLNKGLLGLPESEEIAIRELLKGVSEPKEKIKRLYYYLQDHTRYINVSIGVGGHQAYPASYVSQNKYGDCKALTNYMKALLNYAGIKSYYTLINGSLQPEKLVEELPFPQFNHIILCVPIGNDTIWLENTSTSEPFGYISKSIQNRKALFIDENTSRLINMPKIKNQVISKYRKINITFNNSGDGNVETDFFFRGYYYEQYNQLNTFYNKNDQDRIIRELIPPTSSEIQSWNIIKQQRDSASIGLKVSFMINKYIKPLDTDSYFNLIPILNYSFETPTERKVALLIPWPINFIDSTIYRIPDEFFVKKMPDQVNISNQFGNYELKAFKEGNTFRVYKELLIYSSSYSLEQYKAFYDFIKLIKEAEKKVIVLSKRSSSI